MQPPKRSALCDNLTRIKKPTEAPFSDSQTRRCLSTVDLTFLGMGSVIGAGLFVMTGDLFCNVAGPSVILSFVLVATSALLSAMCYAEFSSRVPKVGSAYLYTYVSMGEIWAFIVGWNMLLEYILAAAILARSCSEYINSVSDGEIFKSFADNFATLNSDWLGSFPDILALLLSIAVTVILSLGPGKASVCNIAAAAIALVSVVFIIAAGMVLVDRKSWTENFASQGAMGILRAGGSLFFVFVGLDAIALASEEAIDPRMSIPLSLTTSYTLSIIIYCGTAVVLTLMTPSGDMTGQFIPLAESFARRGFMLGKYIAGIGGIFATASGLILTTYAASRLVFSMATDGLLFQWLAHTHEEKHSPVRATLINGILIGCLALLVNIRRLMELLSIGTLIAFTSMAVSVLLTRYQTGVRSVTLDEKGTNKTDKWLKKMCCVTSLAQSNYQRLATDQEANGKPEPNDESSFRASVAVCLLIVCLTVLAIVLTNVDFSGASGERAWQAFLLGMFGLLIVFLLVFLERQPKNSAVFPFMVPLVPYFPSAVIFINVVLLVTLHPVAYARIGVWMGVGMAIYIFYGYRHSMEAAKPAEDEEKEFVFYRTPAVKQWLEKPQPG